MDHVRPLEDTTFGVALSGGGVRASFYSMGALMFLVRSRLNSRLRIVASVSGGSIVNGALATVGDVSELDPETFDDFVGRLSARLAKRGVFFWPSWKRLTVAILPLALWGPLMYAWSVFGGWEIGWRGFVLPGLFFLVTMAVSFVAWLVLTRRSIQAALYAEVVGDARGSFGSSAGPMRHLRDLPASSVRHVLCSTDLVSGHPVYFERGMVHSPIFGTGSADDVRIADAIYASAAFPIGFPPLRLRTDRLRLSGGINEDRPDRLVLSDGGVFNNLGTDSFSAFVSLAGNPLAPSIAGLGSERVTTHLIVNASSPAKIDRLSNVWIWRSLVSSKRIMSVLYENTLRPRVQSLQRQSSANNIVIDVAESPIDLVRRLTNDRNLERANAVLDVLRRDRSDAEWRAYTDRASSTKTVLTPIGLPACIRLIRLGAMHASLACHLSLGAEPAFAYVPGEAELRRIIDQHR